MFRYLQQHYFLFRPLNVVLFLFFLQSLLCCCCFFFSSRRRHTRWPRDWSSDVCSSDLPLMVFLPLSRWLLPRPRAGVVSRPGCEWPHLRVLRRAYGRGARRTGAPRPPGVPGRRPEPRTHRRGRHQSVLGSRVLPLKYSRCYVITSAPVNPAVGLGFASRVALFPSTPDLAFAGGEQCYKPPLGRSSGQRMPCCAWRCGIRCADRLTMRNVARTDSSYTARHLSVLEGLEAVRKRPGMYIGSTDSRGLMHCLWEIIDNAVDEALEGHADTIEVLLHADESVEVRDNGRGIPVDNVTELNISGVEVVFTKLHAGGKFGNGSYAASGGLHGVGASVVNALSERLDVQVDRGGKTHAMSFHRGEPGVFEDTGEPNPQAPFTPFVNSSELAVTGKVPRKRTGTRVRYWADRQIFPPSVSFSYDELITRARQTSFLVPGLTLKIRDERRLPGTPGEDGPVEEVFRHDGGVVDFVDFLAADGSVTDVWHIKGEGTFTETVQQLDAKGHLRPHEVERNCEDRKS